MKRRPRAAIAIWIISAHDGYQNREKILFSFGDIVACAGTAGDVSRRFIHALDWGDGGN
jgi:hypothetical protein